MSGVLGPYAEDARATGGFKCLQMPSYAKDAWTLKPNISFNIITESASDFLSFPSLQFFTKILFIFLAYFLHSTWSIYLILSQSFIYIYEKSKIRQALGYVIF